MKAETKEEAAARWQMEAVKRASNCEFPKQSEARMLGILDSYKSALRAEIEPDLATIRETDSFYLIYKAFSDKFLQLLDTVTPKE